MMAASSWFPKLDPLIRRTPGSDWMKLPSEVLRYVCLPALCHISLLVQGTALIPDRQILSLVPHTNACRPPPHSTAEEARLRYARTLTFGACSRAPASHHCCGHPLHLRHTPTRTSAMRPRRRVEGSGIAAALPPTTAATKGSTSRPLTQSVDVQCRYPTLSHS